MSDLTDFMRRPEFIRFYTQIESSGPQKGIIHIEDASDRIFWKKVVETICPDRYDIKPFSQPGCEGKRKLEQLYDELHKDYLVAVDSDYDYLCPDRNGFASKLNANPFILHTYYYSRESFILTPESIVDLTDCVHFHDITRSQMNEALQHLSAIVYDAIVIFSWLHNRDPQTFNESDFNAIYRLPTGVYILDENLNTNEDALGLIRQSVQRYIETHTPYLDEQENLRHHKETLDARGITQENALLFINGHYLLDNIFRPIYELLIRRSKRNDNEWVENNYPENEKRARKNQVRNHYEQNCNAQQLIYRCESYRSSPFWQKIIQKITEIESAGNPVT